MLLGKKNGYALRTEAGLCVVQGRFAQQHPCKFGNTKNWVIIGMNGLTVAGRCHGVFLRFSDALLCDGTLDSTQQPQYISIQNNIIHSGRH